MECHDCGGEIPVKTEVCPRCGCRVDGGKGIRFDKPLAVNVNNCVDDEYPLESSSIPKAAPIPAQVKGNDAKSSDGFSIGIIIYFITVIYHWLVFWNHDYPTVSLTSIIVFPFYSLKAAIWPVFRLF